MKIGLLIAFAGRNCGGPQVYERELARALVAGAPNNEYHLYCLDSRAPEIIGLPEDQVTYHRLQPQARVVSMLTSLPYAIARTKPDVFHALMVPPPFIPSNTVMAIQCSSLIRHPEYYPLPIRLRLRFLLHSAAPKAAYILCPSEHVRDVVHESLRIPMDKLVVTYTGVGSAFRPIDQNETKDLLERNYGITSPYFLFSGRRERRKNILGVLEAFALLKRTRPSDFKLVLSGGESWVESEVKETLKRLNMGTDIIDVGRSPVDELPYLYGGASALIYASFWEGFGMPIVEAMACGTPVITSNTSAMPETAGGAALLVDPTSTEELAAAMDRIATDEPLRARLRKAGLKRAAQFSWELTAAKIQNLYDRLGGGVNSAQNAMCSR